MKISIIALLIGLMVAPCFAQNTAPYWVFFADKDLKDYRYQEHLSEKAIQNRKMLGVPLYQESDAPLNPSYLTVLSNREHVVVAQSKWLNAVVTYLSPNALNELESLPFVAGTLLCGSFSQPSALPKKEKQLGEAIAEMNTSHLFELDLNGKNIDIGVVDAGYYGIYTNA